MSNQNRIKYTEKLKAELWERWKSGETLKAIARDIGSSHSAIAGIFERSGGIRPAERHRAKQALTLSEREEISRSLSQSLSIRSIAIQLQHAPSTISRELKRNGGRETYRAVGADEAAWARAKRPKLCKLADKPALCKLIADKLQISWSPEQIAGWLKKMHPNEDSKTVSHETIYRSLFVQARGVLKKELQKFLRTKRPYRRSRHTSLKGIGLGDIADAVSIRERPAEVEDRAVPGHWEGDLILGSHNSQIATLVERHTRFVMLVKVNRRDTETVVNSLIKHAHKLPIELYKSLTWDRGKELADHKRFSLATDVDVYFCDPSSPWQRGSNENTNRLLRQYFPKGTELSQHSQQQLDDVAQQLNERPRKTLDYDTPAAKFYECVASIS